MHRKKSWGQIFACRRRCPAGPATAAPGDAGSFLKEDYPMCTANVEKAGQLHRGRAAPTWGHWRTRLLKNLLRPVCAYVIPNECGRHFIAAAVKR